MLPRDQGDACVDSFFIIIKLNFRFNPDKCAKWVTLCERGREKERDRDEPHSLSANTGLAGRK